MTVNSGRTLTLRDGRHLGFAEYGKPDGEPGFYFHGHPGSRLEPGFADVAAREAGVASLPSTGLDTVSPISSLTGRSSIGHATWRKQLKRSG